MSTLPPRSAAESRSRGAAVFGTLLLLILLQACGAITGPDDGLGAPPRTGDGWETAAPASVGLDAGRLEQLQRHIGGTPGHRLHSLLIVKDHRLVFERYWPGTDVVPATLEPVHRAFDGNTLHYVASVSKSLTSALVGIAVDKGLIGSLDEPVFSWFPELESLGTETSRTITLRHLLSFSSGFEWNEFVYDFSDPRDSHYQMFHAPDPMAQLLGRPVTTEPGSVFHYNSGDTNVLGEIVRRASGSASLLDFADQHLFQPLGIEEWEWIPIRLVPPLTFASGGASLRPRDMAKVGALYLDGGLWRGTRVLSASWVEASTAMAVPLEGSYRTLYGYGFNWWLGRSPLGAGRADYFRAAGWGGQYIFVYPGLELVVVFTAGAYEESLGLDFNELLEDYILAAVTPLPPPWAPASSPPS